MSGIPSWKKQGWNWVINVEPINEPEIVRNLKKKHGAENVMVIEPAHNIDGHRIKGMHGIYVKQRKRRVREFEDGTICTMDVCTEFDNPNCSYCKTCEFREKKEEAKLSVY